MINEVFISYRLINIYNKYMQKVVWMMDLIAESNKANKLYCHERYEEALEIYQSCYEYSKQVNGEMNKTTISTFACLERCYGKLEDFDKAIEINKKAYQMSLKFFGQNHIQTILIANDLMDNCIYHNQYVSNKQKAMKNYLIFKELLNHKDITSVEELKTLALKYYLKKSKLKEKDKMTTPVQINWIYKTRAKKSDDPLEIVESFNMGTINTIEHLNVDSLDCLSHLVFDYYQNHDSQKLLELDEMWYKYFNQHYVECKDNFLSYLIGFERGYGKNNQYDKALEINRFSCEYSHKYNDNGYFDFITTKDLIDNYRHVNDYVTSYVQAKETYYLINGILRKYKLDLINDLDKVLSYVDQIKKYEKQKEENDSFDELHCLALQYGKEGNYQKQLELNEKCYNGRKKSLGETHPKTLLSLNNLSVSYNNLGNYFKGFQLSKKCYEIKKDILVEEHQDVLFQLKNLASSYMNIGQYEKARELFEKCYQSYKKIFSQSHSKTMSCLASLAEVYGECGNVKKQLEFSLEYYSLCTSVYGQNSDEGIYALQLFADGFGCYGNYKLQNEYYATSYQLAVNLYGKEHPTTIAILNNIAISYLHIGDYKKANTLLIDSYQLHLKKFGPTHPFTVTVLENLAYSYGKIKELPLQKQIIEKCYFYRKKYLGEKHPKTLEDLSRLALSEGQLGHYSHQLELHQKCYSLMIGAFGKEHPKTLIELNHLGQCLGKLGFTQKQMQLNKKSYDLLKEKLGEVNPQTLILLNDLLSAYLINENYDLYEQSFKKYVKLMTKHLSDLYFSMKYGDFRNYLENFVKATKVYLKYYFKYLNEKSTYHYVVAYKNIFYDISLVDYHFHNDHVFYDYLYKVHELKHRNKQNEYSDEENIVTSILFEQLYLDINVDKIQTKLHIYDLLLDYYQLKNGQYGLVIIGKDLFESYVVDDYGVDKIQKHLDHIQHIYICPDGDLYHVSFERFIDKDISYLSSPKGLFYEGNIHNHDDIVSFVSPDFDDTLADDGFDETRGEGKKSSLPGSLVEGHYIRSIFPQAKIYSGKKANATEFLDVHSPSILHVSTHGEYLQDEQNIMERGRLCLAGYNQTNHKEEYQKGYVSANDIQKEMDLKNTNLLVLSACLTAKGDVLPGEGIYGLRRAFELAGVKTMILTVEAIQDHNAAIFMKTFYRKYCENKNVYQSFLETKKYLRDDRQALKELQIYANEFPEYVSKVYPKSYRFIKRHLENYLHLCQSQGYLLRNENDKEDWNGFIIQGKIR